MFEKFKSWWNGQWKSFVCDYDLYKLTDFMGGPQNFETPRCPTTKVGWYQCTRKDGHGGPSALWPKQDNFPLCREKPQAPEYIAPWAAAFHPVYQELIDDWECHQQRSDLSFTYGEDRFLLVQEFVTAEDYVNGCDRHGVEVLVLSNRWGNVPQNMRQAIIFAALYKVKGIEFTETVCHCVGYTHAEAAKQGIRVGQFLQHK